MERWNAAKVYMPDPYLQILAEVIHYDVSGRHRTVEFKKRTDTGTEITLTLSHNTIWAPSDTFVRLQNLIHLMALTPFYNPGEPHVDVGHINMENIRQIAYFLLLHDGWTFVPNRELSILYRGTPGIESKCVACNATTENLAKCSCPCERVYCSRECQATDSHVKGK